LTPLAPPGAILGGAGCFQESRGDGRIAPQQCGQELRGWDQAAHSAFELRLEFEEFDAGPETSLIVEVETLWAAGVIDCLATEVLAAKDSGTRLLPDLSPESLLHRFTGFRMPSRKIPQAAVSGDEDDLPLGSEAHAVGL
jgi:hypothetical protein